MEKDDYHNDSESVLISERKVYSSYSSRAQSFAPSYMFLNFQYTFISPPEIINEIVQS